MVVTAPRQYHAVVNMTACFAVAINFLPTNESIFPKSVRVCRDCGLYPLKRVEFERVSSKPEDGPRRSRTESFAITAPQQVDDSSTTDILIDRESLRKKRENPSSISKSKAKRTRTMQSSSTTMKAEQVVWVAPVLQMATAICSRDAIKQFLNIVRGRRELEPTAL